ncbi:hypothetical protein FF38_11169 [Lucilia cuprina]|uniref:Uncharacterized protein n=1 Tax=Lucilia cuprina TaxID=7375 RepID=A0A0L0BVV3_LUCCU|nr:hypothetical protein FF38_11169 [Lucilia cuprina]
MQQLITVSGVLKATAYGNKIEIAVWMADCSESFTSLPQKVKHSNGMQPVTLSKRVHFRNKYVDEHVEGNMSVCGKMTDMLGGGNKVYGMMPGGGLFHPLVFLDDRLTGCLLLLLLLVDDLAGHEKEEFKLDIQGVIKMKSSSSQFLKKKTTDFTTISSSRQIIYICKVICVYAHVNVKVSDILHKMSAHIASSVTSCNNIKHHSILIKTACNLQLKNL